MPQMRTLGPALLSATLVATTVAAASAATRPATAPTVTLASPATAPGVAAPDVAAASATGATGGGAHVVAVGDIAYPGGSHERVAGLVEQLGPARVLLAGDLAYPDGTAAQFAEVFHPSWGSFRDSMLPVPGNHEYHTPRAAGYRQYFAERGGLWWSRQVGAWRVIGLDSQRVGSTKQRRWLTRQLKRHDGVPTLVMWHRPRFSRGMHDDQRDTAPLYRLVKRDRDVKLLIWGHDHNYERMEIPVRRRPTALPAFVVGTGGVWLRCATTNEGRRWSRVFDCQSHGVLDLRLRERSFSWAFVGVDGQLGDRGSYQW